MVEEYCCYGIKSTEKVTPVMVRDAIVDCFCQAQEEIMHEIKITADVTDDLAEKLCVNDVIAYVFAEVDADFEHPTKQQLYKVVEKLKDVAKDALRDQEVINKHADEIKKLIDRIPQEK